MAIILSLLMSLSGVGALAGDAVIFNGNNIKALKQNYDFNGSAQILTGTVDPTSSATNAKSGSLYLNTSSSTVYKKNDNGSTTNWTDFQPPSQAGSLISDGYWAASNPANCLLIRNSTTLGTFNAGTTAQCPAYTQEVTGAGYSVSGPNLVSPFVTVTNLVAGVYEVDVLLNGAATTGSQAELGVNDGTDTHGVSSWTEFGGTAFLKQTRAYFTYTSTATRTFTIYTAQTSAFQVNQQGAVGGGGPYRMTIKRLQ